jgi:RimJ/RimL family protein N-acetyltransferase
MKLQTERLVLRPVTEDDVDVMLAIRNEPGVVATADTPTALPREQMESRVRRRVEYWRTHGLGSWLILLDGAPVGFVEVAPIGDGSGVDPDEIELGVVVHPDHWGKGFAGEAGLAVAADCFERVGLERVYAGVDPTNEKSLRVVSKAPGIRKIDEELYELTAEAFGAASSGRAGPGAPRSRPVASEL